MPPTPLVTVVIPCHDEVEALGRTLAGIVAQRGGTADVEVVLVDNASTDPRLDQVWWAYRDALDLMLIRRGALEHPFALCAARNLGLAVARGRWIWTLDADSIPAPGALAAARANLGPAAVILTGERRFIDGSELTEEAVRAGADALLGAPPVLSASNYELARDRRFPELERLPAVEQPWDYLVGGNTLFRRADALAVGGYDEGFDGHWGYEDDEFAHRMIVRGGCVPRFVPGLEVFHQEPAITPPWSRRAKDDNPNWHRVCRLIPGYREHKLARYRERGIDVHA